MQDKPVRKKSVNVTVAADLLAEAKAAGTNLSALLEKALDAELKERRWMKWREENRAALEAYDRHIAQDGVWLDELRTW